MISLNGVDDDDGQRITGRRTMGTNEDNVIATGQKGKPKKPIQILRERLGGVPKELVERNRQQIKVRKQITATLADGPKIVPEIAERTGLPTHEVFWHLMAMKKYGKVVEGDERDDYFEYAPKKEEETEP